MLPPVQQCTVYCCQKLSLKQPRYKKQSGAVLVIALLIVAIITALAVDFSSRFQLSLGRAENRFFTAQMQQSLMSLEHVAMWALREDKKEDISNGNKLYDHLVERWAKSNDYKALIQAEFTDILINDIYIEDAQGRFNINQLGSRSGAYDASKSFGERYESYEKRFIRLLQTVPNGVVDTSTAEAITQSVMDWIDSNNSVTGAGGAESDYYSSQETRFRAANNLMVSVSELRLIKGVTEEIYEWIAPLVIALPDNTSGINVNTALPQVLQSLNSSEESVPITDEDAETLKNSRPVLAGQGSEESPLSNVADVKEDGFTSVEDFLDSSEVEALFGSDQELMPALDGLTTGSDYFLLTLEVELDTIKRRMYSLLKRSVDPKTSVAQLYVIKRGSEDIF